MPDPIKLLVLRHSFNSGPYLRDFQASPSRESPKDPNEVMEQSMSHQIYTLKITITDHYNSRGDRSDEGHIGG